MKKTLHLYIFSVILLFLLVPIVRADVGELRYQITDFNINDSEKTIEFEGWAFLHKTNNYNTVYALVNGYDTSNSNIVASDGGQQIKITAYSSDGDYIDSVIVDGDSKKNYNYTYRMYYHYGNDTFEEDYNNSAGHNGTMDCVINNNKSNCYYKDLHFKVLFRINRNWYNKNIYFTISVTNNDYKRKTGRSWSNEEKLHILSNIYGGPKINENSKIVKIIKNSTVNKVKFLAETALVKNITDWSSLGPYGHTGDIFLVKNYDENGYSGIKGTHGIGRYFLYSDGVNDCNIVGEKWKNKLCYYGIEEATNIEIGAWSSWVIPYGNISFAIRIKNDKKCSIDKENSIDLSCNGSSEIVSECNELTIYSENDSAVIGINQTGIFANLLSPMEIYNGGGIKFGLLYYNKIIFNYLSGSQNINISDVMKSRIIGYDNVSLEKLRIGDIIVDSSYIKKQCKQNIDDNFAETICIFYFTPQYVNGDGSVIKDNVDSKYDMGINNKYYLPLNYNPLYKVSASLMNASLLNEDKAKDDGEENIPWYGNKWKEIPLSSDGSCDIFVYKLGPGKNITDDRKIIYKFIYRPVDLKNPFPGQNRIAGLNWYEWYSSNLNKNRLEKSYDKLQYSIEINNNVINKIKKYNNKSNYFNFNFDEFIKETGVKVGVNE